jgi:hypothetical protein
VCWGEGELGVEESSRCVPLVGTGGPALFCSRRLSRSVVDAVPPSPPPSPPPQRTHPTTTSLRFLCPPGSIQSTQGGLCPMGTYSRGGAECAPCPRPTLGLGLGLPSADACTPRDPVARALALGSARLLAMNGSLGTCVGAGWRRFATARAGAWNVSLLYEVVGGGLGVTAVNLLATPGVNVSLSAPSWTPQVTVKPLRLHAPLALSSRSTHPTHQAAPPCTTP